MNDGHLEKELRGKTGKAELLRERTLSGLAYFCLSGIAEAVFVGALLLAVSVFSLKLNQGGVEYDFLWLTSFTIALALLFYLVFIFLLRRSDERPAGRNDGDSDESK